MASSLAQFSPARARVRLNRIPFFSRVVLLLIVAFWAATLLLGGWVSLWGAVVPAEVGLATMYRLNTYPFVHWGLLHTLVNTIAFIPLLERFEAEHGTLVSLALFAGPFATFPGAVYILIDHIILRRNSPMLGASVWVFLLFSCEAIKLYRSNPYFALGPYKIPTWISPLAVIFVAYFLDPNSSLLAHLSGAAIGYGFELGFLKFLIPPEKILRFVEGKLDLLGRLPHYVSVDQKTYGRYGVLPTAMGSPGALDAVESGRAFNVDSP